MSICIILSNVPTGVDSKTMRESVVYAVAVVNSRPADLDRSTNSVNATSGARSLVLFAVGGIRVGLEYNVTTAHIYIPKKTLALNRRL